MVRKASETVPLVARSGCARLMELNMTIFKIGTLRKICRVTLDAHPRMISVELSSNHIDSNHATSVRKSQFVHAVTFLISFQNTFFR